MVINYFSTTLDMTTVKQCVEKRLYFHSGNSTCCFEKIDYSRV